MRCVEAADGVKDPVSMPLINKDSEDLLYYLPRHIFVGILSDGLRRKQSSSITTLYDTSVTELRQVRNSSLCTSHQAKSQTAFRTQDARNGVTVP
eukprot:7047411-Pyramimonas_sp.AAC.2